MWFVKVPRFCIAPITHAQGRQDDWLPAGFGSGLDCMRQLIRRLRYLAWLAICLATVLAPGTAAAQANLFNVPSGDIASVHEVFFQEQLNLTRRFGQSNTTIDYGLSPDFEVGMNFLDVSLYDRLPAVPFNSQMQVSPDLMFNCQHAFHPTDWWQIAVGTQVGLNPASQARSSRLLNFSWITNEFLLPEERGKVYLGTYYANHPYAGPGEAVGFLAGTEIPIVKDKFSLMGDLITGNNDLAVAVLGGVYNLPQRWQLSAGVQVPTRRSEAFSGLVLELTRTGIAPTPDNSSDR